MWELGNFFLAKGDFSFTPKNFIPEKDPLFPPDPHYLPNFLFVEVWLKKLGKISEGLLKHDPNPIDLANKDKLT